MTTGANSPLAGLPFETGATGGSKGGRTKAASKLFCKLFQIQAVFVQAFPNKALAVLWDFKELQASKT
jgi:hypothetical protein